MDSGAQDGLFDESLVERVVPDVSVIETGAGIHKRFKAFDPDAVIMAPPRNLMLLVLQSRLFGGLRRVWDDSCC